MAGSQTGTPGATRTVRIVYEIDGVEGAVTDQEALEGALQRTGEALGEQSERVERVESALGSLSDVATRSEQAQARMHQQVQALAAGLSGLSTILGNDTEAGALLGRMGQFASVGIQIGSIFGPGGAIVGGIVGGLLPALDPLLERLGVIHERQDEVSRTASSMSQEWDAASAAARQLASDIGALEQAQSQLQQRQQRARARRLRSGEVGSAEDADLAAQMRRDDMVLLAGMGGVSGLVIGATSADPETERLEALAEQMRSQGARRSRGGGARRERDVLGELMQRASGGSDAVGFAAGLDAADVSGRPSDFEVEGADLRRQGRNRRFGGQTQAEIRAVQLLAEKQKEAHEAQMERISQQVDAWTDAGQKIGGTVYSAFTTAISGQESFEVAMVKGFKSLAIQFGGQMVNEGIAALLTAAGNAVANPPVAATKAAEGAGKLALGIGLGAAGAAIPVPSSGGGGQAKPPRLGPAQPDTGGGSSVIVNMNAPSVVTSTEAQLGRSLGRSLNEARLRYGRAA